MNNLRRVQRLIQGQWEDCHMYELQKAQVFRMFEPTGEQVVGEYGSTEWIATSDPYQIDGVWAVDIEYYDVRI